jgi:hypothetical protein
MRERKEGHKGERKREKERKKELLSLLTMAQTLS